MVGNIAISLAGHDKEKAYVIIKEEKGFVYLSNGKEKPLDKLKRKRKKHVAENKTYDIGEVATKLLKEERVTDTEIKRCLKLYGGRTCQKQT